MFCNKMNALAFHHFLHVHWTACVFWNACSPHARVGAHINLCQRIKAAEEQHRKAVRRRCWHRQPTIGVEVNFTASSHPLSWENDWLYWSVSVSTDQKQARTKITSTKKHMEKTKWPESPCMSMGMQKMDKGVSIATPHLHIYFSFTDRLCIKPNCQSQLNQRGFYKLSTW